MVIIAFFARDYNDNCIPTALAYRRNISFITSLSRETIVVVDRLVTREAPGRQGVSMRNLVEGRGMYNQVKPRLFRLYDGLACRGLGRQILARSGYHL